MGEVSTDSDSDLVIRNIEVEAAAAAAERGCSVQDGGKLPEVFDNEHSVPLYTDMLPCV